MAARQQFGELIVNIGAVMLLLLFAPKALAVPSYLDSWRDEYPNSTSGDVRCQLCHVTRDGGSPWNSYGRAIRNTVNSFAGTDRTIEDAFRLLESANSDQDLAMETNIVEINLNRQPGWRAGRNNFAYDRDDNVVGVFFPPVSVDPYPEKLETINAQFSLEEAASGFTAPVGGVVAPVKELENQMFVVDQTGVVWQLDLDTAQKQVFLDLSDLLVPLGAFSVGGYDERGLLGFAFHPDYARNGLVYSYTSEPVSSSADFSTLTNSRLANHQSVVREHRLRAPSSSVISSGVISSGTGGISSGTGISTGGTGIFTSGTGISTSGTGISSSGTGISRGGQANLIAQRELIRFDQPQFNHNGGALLFDQDKYLLISLGDGGGSDDQGLGHSEVGNGADPSNPYGAILRIDPLGSNSTNGRYGIPADNPFVGSADVAQEIFAYGFRNPWKMAFDQQGNLLVADVGQNDIEEVNLVSAGKHYGWPIREGSFFFNANDDQGGIVSLQPVNGFPNEVLSDPLFEYDHDEGISVTGGFVYRGRSNRQLRGKYLFADFNKRLLLGDLSSGDVQALGLVPDIFIYSIAEDAQGELYLLGNKNAQTSGLSGSVVRLRADPSLEDPFCLSIPVKDKTAVATVCL